MWSHRAGSQWEEYRNRKPSLIGPGPGKPSPVPSAKEATKRFMGASKSSRGVVPPGNASSPNKPSVNTGFYAGMDWEQAIKLQNKMIDDLKAIQEGYGDRIIALEERLAIYEEEERAG
jgi:hypothetical protein